MTDSIRLNGAPIDPTANYRKLNEGTNEMVGADDLAALEQYLTANSRDPQHVLQGFRRPGQREPHGPLTGPRVAEHGPGPGEHLLPGVQLSFLSSYSDGGGTNCVEVADGYPGLVPVRDSKVSDGRVLVFGALPWEAFVARLKA